MKVLVEKVSFENVVPFTDVEEEIIVKIIESKIPESNQINFFKSNNNKYLNMAISIYSKSFTKKEEETLFNLFVELAYRNASASLYAILKDKSLINNIEFKSEWMTFNFDLNSIVFDFNSALDKAYQYLKQCISLKIEELFVSAHEKDIHPSNVYISKNDLESCAIFIDDEFVYESESGSSISFERDELSLMNENVLKEKLYNFYNNL
jgi:hypothetical protein